MREKLFYINSEVVTLPAIGQGCMGIGGEFTVDYHNDKEQIEALQYGIDLGMTLIDTAEVYGAGHSEELVGKAIKGRRSDVIVATKFSPEHSGYLSVIAAAEQSLKRLGTDYIDIYQIHWPNPTIPLETTLCAMERLVAHGKVRFMGVSNFYEQDLEKAKAILEPNQIISNQLEFNLFDRFVERSALPYCQENNIVFLAHSPLDRGRLAPVADRLVLKGLTSIYNKTVSQIILNWIVNYKNVIAIPKAVSKEHILQNAAAVDFDMIAEHYAAIDNLFPDIPIYVGMKYISVSVNGEGNRQVYQTVEEAKANHLNLVPSPIELAKELKKGYPVKPVRLIWNKDHYDLIEGRNRYWAYYIAFNGETAIPAYIRQR